MPDLTTHPNCCSDLRFDALLAGELDRRARGELHAHLSDCTACSHRLDAIVRERAAWLTRVPAFEDLRALADTPKPSRARTARWRWAAPLAAAVALLLLARLPGEHVNPGLEPPTMDTTRSKGLPHVGFFIKRGRQVLRGEPGAVVHPGDRLRFTYASGRPHFMALFNRDGRGSSVYYPRGRYAARAPAGQDVALDFGIELDAYIGVEHVYAVFCEGRFEVEPLRRELSRAGSIRTPDGCLVEVLELNKAPLR